MNVSFKPQAVSVSVSPDRMGINLGNQVIREHDEPYEGEYTVTPTQEVQVLDTGKKYMKAPVIINPIPSNYGRIDWNGSYLTVS